MNNPRRFLWLALFLAVPCTAVVAQTPAAASASDGYQLPPAALRAIVDAPRPPQLSISPRRDLLSLTQSPSLPGIDVVAQPELKLAGLRINPRS